MPCGHSPGKVKNDPHLTASGYVEVPAGRKVFRDSFCPVPGCGTWTRKMKDHAFKSHLSHFVKLPVRVMGLDPVLFH
jgi:hypothetical protein